MFDGGRRTNNRLGIHPSFHPSLTLSLPVAATTNNYNHTHPLQSVPTHNNCVTHTPPALTALALLPPNALQPLVSTRPSNINTVKSHFFLRLRTGPTKRLALGTTSPSHPCRAIVAPPSRAFAAFPPVTPNPYTRLIVCRPITPS